MRFAGGFASIPLAENAPKTTNKSQLTALAKVEYVALCIISSNLKKAHEVFYSTAYLIVFIFSAIRAKQKF
jgi:hypothetical protein